MIEHQISKDIKIIQTQLHHAEELFTLIDSNREHIGRWLPWVETTREIKDTRDFIEYQLSEFAENSALNMSIVYKGDIIGMVSFNKIDTTNHRALIGYWLAERYTSLGIMTQSVKALIDLGHKRYNLNTIEISCATKNYKSQAIPMKLGFIKTKTIQGAELSDGIYLDNFIYEMSL